MRHNSNGRRRRVYLSIDLDYWGYDFRPPEGTQEAATAFFNRVFALRLPIRVVRYHHLLIPHINASECNAVVNVDYHSDLADNESADPADLPKLSEGTWANHVVFASGGSFEWRCPDHAKCYTYRGGTCHGTHDPFVEYDYSPWREKVRIREGLVRLPWRSIAAVGVSLSRRWLGSYRTVEPVVARLGIRDWLRQPGRPRTSIKPTRRTRRRFIRSKLCLPS